MVWGGLGWFGMVWDGLGMVWDGLEWFGMVWDDLGWFGDGLGPFMTQTVSCFC